MDYILITGAGGGIGEATAIEFAARWVLKSLSTISDVFLR